ncbi:MAG: hypothetical protein J6B43_01280 [Lachnospiraceae bacterium]|nr:hypothetical protein [Lachnospiraceae bacterium]
MQVIGTAEEVRNLERGVKETIREIRDLLADIHSQTTQLESTFQDTGMDEVKDIVTQMSQATLVHLDDVAALCQALGAYAEVLERNN